MIDTILLDLDGTLLPFRQEDFVRVYFAELEKVFIDLKFDSQLAVKAVWAGTKAMAKNDGTVTNRERFWDTFAGVMGLSATEIQAVEEACNSFYENEFNAAKAVMAPCDVSGRMVRELIDRGYTVVLATNPLFPACAVTTRLHWIGLTPEDFALITNYANSRFCKPNLRYYEEVLKAIDKKPEQCLMAGNNAHEDMCAGAFGIATFLVTDYVEQENEGAYPADRTGTLNELEAYLLSLPSQPTR